MDLRMFGDAARHQTGTCAQSGFRRQQRRARKEFAAADYEEVAAGVFMAVECFFAEERPDIVRTRAFDRVRQFVDKLLRNADVQNLEPSRMPDPLSGKHSRFRRGHRERDVGGDGVRIGIGEWSSGMRTVMLTIVISAVAAWLKPIKTDDDGAA